MEFKIKFYLMFCLLFVLGSNLIYAEHTFNFPNYFDVNVSEEITITDGDLSDQRALLFLDGVVTNFTIVDSNTTFKLFVTGTKEEDLPYFIQIYNVSTVQEVVLSSDLSRESFIAINDQSMYAFNRSSTDNHTNGDLENHDICAFIKNQLGTTSIQTFVAYDNGTDIIFENSTIIQSVTNSAYGFVCIDTPQTYQHNVSNYTEYFGFRCTNCDTSNIIRLGIDTTGSANRTSQLFLNESSTPIQNNLSNYMLVMFELDGEPLEEFFGTFKFRIPFYINMTLYNTKNTTFNTNFDYIYLQKVNNTASINKALVDSAKMINTIGSFGYLNSNTIDQTETFYGEVVNNQALIKLYEASNYSINLLTVKTFIKNGWASEFTKPQYTKSKVETVLDSNLRIDLEVNSSVNVLLSEYESNKSGFIFNWVKWAFLSVLLIGGIVLGFMSGSPLKVIPAVIFIWTILVKLIGGIDL